MEFLSEEKFTVRSVLSRNVDPTNADRCGPPAAVSRHSPDPDPTENPFGSDTVQAPPTSAVPRPVASVRLNASLTNGAPGFGSLTVTFW